MAIRRFGHGPAARTSTGTRDPASPRKGSLDGGVCPDCHAISRKNRWFLDEAEYVSVARTGAVLRRCPACRKIADAVRSGVLILRGRFLRTHRDENFTIVRNAERRARRTNPRERIAAIRHRDESVEILTTDETRPAHRREIRKAYQGTLSTPGPEGEDLIRMNWSRTRRGNAGRAGQAPPPVANRRRGIFIRNA